MAVAAWGIEPGLRKGRNVNIEAGAAGWEGSWCPEEGEGDSVYLGRWEQLCLGLCRVHRRCLRAVGRKVGQTLFSGRHCLPPWG